MHSPTDVVAGASLSVIVVTLGLVFGASLDYHLTAYKPSSLSFSSGLVGQALSEAHTNGMSVYTFLFYPSNSLLPLCVPFFAWLLLLAYPTPVPPSRNYAEVAAVLGCASGWVLGSSWCLGGLLLRGKDQQRTGQTSTGSPSSADGILSLLCRIFVDAIGGSGGKYSNESDIQFEPERLLSSFPFMALPPNLNLHLHSKCVKHLPCLSADCLWMVALRTVIGLALLVITQVAAAHFFAQVMPRFTCLGPRKFQIHCMKAVLRSSRINDVLGDLLRLHEFLPNFPHHYELAADIQAFENLPKKTTGTRTPNMTSEWHEKLVHSVLKFFLSPTNILKTWRSLVEGGELTEDSGRSVASTMEWGKRSNGSGTHSGSRTPSSNRGNHAKRSGSNFSPEKNGGSGSGSSHNQNSSKSSSNGSTFNGNMRSPESVQVIGTGSKIYGQQHTNGTSSGNLPRALMHDEIGVDAFGSYIGMNGVTDLKSAAVVVSNLLNGNVGVVSSHGVNGKNHLQASNGTFSGRVSSWRFTFTRALADLGGGAPVAAADYERSVPVYYLTYLCVGVTASLVVPFILQCCHLL